MIQDAAGKREMISERFRWNPMMHYTQIQAKNKRKKRILTLIMNPKMRSQRLMSLWAGIKMAQSLHVREMQLLPGILPMTLDSSNIENTLQQHQKQLETTLLQMGMRMKILQTQMRKNTYQQKKKMKSTALQKWVGNAILRTMKEKATLLQLNTKTGRTPGIR